MNALRVVSVAILIAAPACRTDVPPQRPVHPDSANYGNPDVDLDGVDTDRDGVPDRTDVCPNDAEDRDQFEDDDGCPDFDNDRDRVLDANDLCPNEPETYNGIADEDGCPDRAWTSPLGPPTKLPPANPILFDEGSAKVAPGAKAILDSIAAFINDHPEIVSVTIAGHAAAYEKHRPALAAARAEAVRRYLIEHGVRAEIIRVAPFGDGTSVCDQSDRRCPSRGVEYHITIKS